MSKAQSPKSDFQTQSFNVRTNADLEVWTSDFGLYYESHGVGAALILIPGFASGAWTWFRQTDELSRDFRVITFDPRGIGKSKTDKNDLQNLSMKTFVEDVLSLLDFLKIEKAHILGASFVLSNGKNVAPALVENLVKENYLVSQCFLYGDGKSYCVAFITLNQAEAEMFARANKIEFESFADLTRRAEILESIRETVAKANAKVSSSEQIKKFEILERDFSVELNEITPTMKLKRNVISEKFRDEIENLYGQKL